MAKWIHPNGDTIVTEGTTYTITQNGVSRSADIERWGYNATQWMINDVKDGYYQGFIQIEETE